MANTPDVREAAVLLMELRRLKFARRAFDDATRLPHRIPRGDAFAFG